MPPIFCLLLLLGHHPLVRVLAHDHMDQDDNPDEDHSSFPSLKGNIRGLISGDPYAIRPSHLRRISLHEEVKPTKEKENTEKVVEVDVTKEYGIEVTKEYGIELVAIQVGEGSDENIIEMDVAMMEQSAEGVEGAIDGLRMEVFNEVVLEELLQEADRSSQHFPWKVLWLALGLGSIILAVLLLSVLLGVYCWRRRRAKKHVISNM